MLPRTRVIFLKLAISAVVGGTLGQAIGDSYSAHARRARLDRVAKDLARIQADIFDAVDSLGTEVALLKISEDLLSRTNQRQMPPEVPAVPEVSVCQPVPLIPKTVLNAHSFGGTSSCVYNGDNSIALTYSLPGPQSYVGCTFSWPAFATRQWESGRLEVTYCTDTALPWRVNYWQGKAPRRAFAPLSRNEMSEIPPDCYVSVLQRTAYRWLGDDEEAGVFVEWGNAPARGSMKLSFRYLPNDCP